MNAAALPPPASLSPASPEVLVGDPRGSRLLEQMEQVEKLLPRGLEAREESVHKLRVALRRTRVLARELEDEGRSDAPRLRALRAAATQLFRALGGLRDLDILEREWRDLLEAGSLPGPPAVEIADWIRLERQRLRTGLAPVAAAYLEAATRFRAQGGPVVSFASGHASGALRHGLRRRACRLLKQLDRARREPTDEELHGLRIRGKQLRYAAEAAAKDAPGASLESRLKTLQDALGALQDAVTVAARFEVLGAGETLPGPVAAPVRTAAAQERERRRRAFLDDLEAGLYDDLLREVSEVAAKAGNGGGESRDADGSAAGERLPLEKIPGIGAAKARRLAEAGLATPEAIRSASVEQLAAVKTIGPHQARLIKAFVEGDGSPNGPASEGDSEEPDGKRFERIQSVLAVGAAVADYSRTLGEELSRLEEGDAVRAARQAERLAEALEDLGSRLSAIPTKRLKGLRGELREIEGLLAKVLDLDTTSLKMNKLRKALKAHRKAVETYLS